MSSSPDPFGLAGRTVIVTGASRGIGRAVAKAFSQAGAKVVLNYRQDDKAAASLLAELEDRKDDILLCKGSVTDAAFVDAMVAETLERWGAVDCLVNNAGITRDMYVGMMTEAQWDEVLETNAKSAFLCAKRVLKPMAAQRRGVIINVSSQSATYGRAGQVNYAASKAALLGLTRALAREVGRYGIRVNAMVIGLVDTDMTKRLPRKILDPILAETPLGRMARPEEIAHLALFLASDFSSYMTGSCVEITGGL